MNILEKIYITFWFVFFIAAVLSVMFGWIERTGWRGGVAKGAAIGACLVVLSGFVASLVLSLMTL